MDDATFALRVPKVENHVHLDGSWDLDYLLELTVEFADQLVESVPDVFSADPGATVQVRAVAEEIKAAYQQGPELGSKRQMWQGPPETSSNTKPDSPALRLLRAHSTVDHETCDNLGTCLRPFLFFAPIVGAAAAKSVDHIEEMARRFVGRQKASNILYTEVRYSPHMILEHSPRHVLEAVRRGLQAGEKLYGVKVVQILCSISHAPHWAASLEELLAEEMKRRAERGSNSVQAGDVVSVDVAAGEAHFESTSLGEAHRNLCQSAHDKLGYDITIHAGEDSGKDPEVALQAAEHVCRAVTDHRAIRIGHGYQAWASDEAQSMLCQPAVANSIKEDPGRQMRCLHFECCPSSSVNTGGYARGAPWTNHPLKRIYNAAKAQQGGSDGVRKDLPPISCGINTDDPSLFNISLADEYLLCLEKIGLSREDLLRISLMQIDSLFIPPAMKQELVSAVKHFYKTECNIEVEH